MIALFFLSTTLTFANDLPELKTVNTVDLNRYLGTWYEIARFPNRFQKDCDQAKAEYKLVDENEIEVTNTCKKLSDGSLKQVQGVAKIVDEKSNAKLKVNFVPGWLRWTGIGNGNYWIIELDSEYQYAVISEPDREYLWILSRTPSISKKLYDELLKKISAHHLDVSKLIFSNSSAIKDNY